MKRDAKFAKRVVNEDRLVSNNNFETSSSSAIEEMKSAEIGDVQAAPSVSAKKALKVCKRKLMTGMGRAVSDWGMIREGDRVMVGVSGGKDSLSLLHLLLELKRRAPINFEVGAVTIDPGTEAFDPRPLIPYIRDTLGVPYYVLRRGRQDFPVGRVQKPVLHLLFLRPHEARGDLRRVPA